MQRPERGGQRVRGSQDSGWRKPPHPQPSLKTGEVSINARGLGSPSRQGGLWRGSGRNGPGGVRGSLPLTLGPGRGCACHPGPARQGPHPGSQEAGPGARPWTPSGEGQSRAGAAPWALPRPALPRLGRSAPSPQFPALRLGGGSRGGDAMGKERRCRGGGIAPSQSPRDWTVRLGHAVF